MCHQCTSYTAPIRVHEVGIDVHTIMRQVAWSVQTPVSPEMHITPFTHPCLHPSIQFFCLCPKLCHRRPPSHPPCGPKYNLPKYDLCSSMSPKICHQCPNAGCNNISGLATQVICATRNWQHQSQPICPSKSSR